MKRLAALSTDLLHVASARRRGQDAQRTRRPKSQPPTLEDAARFFARRAGVKEADFLATARSFMVNTNMSRADKKIKSYGVLETPTLIVNGKYRINMQAVKKTDEMIALVLWLVRKETP